MRLNLFYAEFNVADACFFGPRHVLLAWSCWALNNDAHDLKGYDMNNEFLFAGVAVWSRK